MSSALKPALPAGAAAAASPGKATAAAPALVGQNLTHHQPVAAHAAQSLAHVPMSPVSQNMAQMAQNMSHHGNLSHVGQNNGAPALGASNGAPQPIKPSSGAPLSLVHDKGPATASQPLALTRPTDKKEESDATPSQSNGTVESPKPPVPDPPQQEPEKSKLETGACPAKLTGKPPIKLLETSPVKPIDSSLSKPVEKSPTNPTEKATVPPAITPKVESNSPSDNLLQVNKLGSTTDTPDTASPSKPKDAVEPSPNVASVPTVSKPALEPKVPDESASAKTNKTPDKTEVLKAESKPVEPEPKTPANPETPVDKKDSKPDADKPTEAKTDQADGPTPAESKTPVKNDQKSPTKKEEQKLLIKKEEPKKEPPKEVTNTPPPKKEDPKLQEVPNTPTPKKTEAKTPTPKSTLKLATVTPTARKRRQESKSPVKTSADAPSAAKKPAEGDTSTPDSRLSKRNRTKVQPYQSPTPELAMATKLSASAGRSTPTKLGDDKLIVFYKNEYLAVRNAEGGFYVCQAVQNVYRSTRKIKIRWLSQDKSLDPSGETYKPDFYDVTDMECVLTTISMARASGGAQVLSAAEAARASSILERAISAEQGGRPAGLQLTEEHPDGLDLSLYKDESQLEKKKKSSRKRNSSKASLDKSASDHEDAPKEEEAVPTPKRAKATPKKSPKSAPKVAKSAPKTPNNNNKRKSAAGSVTPNVASKIAPNVASKTAVATPSKAGPAKTPAKKAKPTPAKKTPAKPAAPGKPEPPTNTPTQRGKTPKKNDKESKIAVLAATPSTSTGKATRTPRKPPSKKRRSSANNFILR